MKRATVREGSESAAAFYEGEAGEAYHAQRAGARADTDQHSRARFFEGVTGQDHVVLDFGCGTGGLLARLPAARRIGIEINPAAAALAQTRLDAVHATLDAVPDASVDRVISFHAIEHVEAPIATLRVLARKLKPAGSARLIVPLEGVFLNAEQRRWRAGNGDMHLFCWTPLTFGNALSTAGFQVEDVRIAPFSGGGRAARLLAFWPAAERLATWIKALLSKRLQLVADVRLRD